MEELINSAEKSFNLGNYKESQKHYKKLFKKANNYDDKNDFRNRAELSAEHYIKVINLDIGEASFPVYHEAENNASIITIKITDTPSGSRQFNIEKVKDTIRLFLDDYLSKYASKIIILDWGVNNLYAEVKNIPNKNPTFNNFTELIDGRSFELAASVALISRLLNTKIPDGYSFSGVIETNGKKNDYISGWKYQ